MLLELIYCSAYDSFLEWNPDPEIANAASKLYGGDINNLELYGMQGVVPFNLVQF